MQSMARGLGAGLPKYSTWQKSGWPLEYMPRILLQMRYDGIRCKTTLLDGLAILNCEILSHWKEVFQAAGKPW
jgi:hypothetical protein